MTSLVENNDLGPRTCSRIVNTTGFLKESQSEMAAVIDAGREFVEGQLTK